MLDKHPSFTIFHVRRYSHGSPWRSLIRGNSRRQEFTEQFSYQQNSLFWISYAQYFISIDSFFNNSTAAEAKINYWIIQGNPGNITDGVICFNKYLFPTLSYRMERFFFFVPNIPARRSRLKKTWQNLYIHTFSGYISETLYVNAFNELWIVIRPWT